MSILKKQAGFTLTEVLIVGVIIAVLAMIAFPAYNNHMRAASRADAQANLMGFANAMEKFYTDNGTYEDAADGTPPVKALASVYASQSPVDTASKSYDLVIQSATTDTYVLRATPISSNPTQKDDGYLELTSAGVKRWDKDNDGSVDPATEHCWQKEC